MMFRTSIAFTTLMCIASGIGAADAPSTQPSTKTLAEQLDIRVADFQFDGTLKSAVDSLREKNHLNIIVDWQSLMNNGIEPGTVVRIHMWDIELGQAINALFDVASRDRSTVALDMADDILMIESTIGTNKPIGEVQIYDVRELLDAAVALRKPDPAQPKSPDALQDEESEKLCKLIQVMVDSETWSEYGGSGVIKCWSGRLFVRQLPMQQRHVAALIEKIRNEQRKP